MYDMVLSKEVCKQIAFDIYDAVCRDVALEEKEPCNKTANKTEGDEKYEH